MGQRKRTIRGDRSRTSRRNRNVMTAIRLLGCGAALWLMGCVTGNPVTGGGSGGTGNGNRNQNQNENGNRNDNGSPPGQATETLPAISFNPSERFPQNRDPATFEMDGGSITASGGAAGTVGLPGLYADDSFAWVFSATGAQGEITFADLDVVAIDGFWVYPNTQANFATMTAHLSGGGSRSVAAAPVNAFGGFGQSVGFFQTIMAPEGETITELTFQFPALGTFDDVAALDVLELTVRTD